MMAYKALGGSCAGDLAVDPTRLRQLRTRGDAVAAPGATEAPGGSARSRRIRDAVESALSDILLLGTDEQVRLAARAATELAAGRPVHTAERVVSLRDFVRKALELPPVPVDLVLPKQGPTRPSPGKARGDGGGDAEKGGGGGLGGMAAGGAGLSLGDHTETDARHPH